MQVYATPFRRGYIQVSMAMMLRVGNFGISASMRSGLEA